MKAAILNKAMQIPFVSILLTIAAAGIHYFYSLRPELLYTRAALKNGEFWRIASCHWVHLNADHLLWSGMTFLVLGSLCEMLDRKKYLLSIGLSAALIPVSIWFAMPHLDNYGGLSGLDCTLYALLAASLIRREWRARNWIWVIAHAALLGLLVAKIVYEMDTGLTIFVDNNNTRLVPVPLSHLVGGLVGIVAGVPIAAVKKNFRPLDLHIIKTAVKNLKEPQSKLPQLQKGER